MKLATKINLILYLCCFIFYSKVAFSDAKKEFTVKAAFMVKLTHFIKWPDTSIKSDRTNFTICIHSSHKLDDALTLWAKSGLIKNKPVSIKHLENDSRQIAGCDMLYITNNNKLQLLLNQAKNNNTLTVSDIPGNAERGVLINFINRKEKLRFEINLASAQKLGFKINPRLLKLATIVNSEGIEK